MKPDTQNEPAQTELPIEAISAAMEVHMHKETDDNGRTLFGYTHEVAEIVRLSRVESALRTFAKSKGSMCAFHPQAARKPAHLTMDPPLICIRDAARNHLDSCDEVFPLHRLPPRYQALTEVVDRYTEWDFVQLRKLGREDEDALRRLYSRTQRFEHELRAALKAPELILIENSLSRKVNANYQAGSSLIQACLDCRSRVDSVRVDLYFRKGSAMRYADRTPEDQEAKAQQVMNQRNQLLKRMRMKYGRELLGYLCKVEYGEDQGFHLHTWFLLDGHRHQETISIANYIASLWTTITFGEGHHFDPGKSDRYAHRGIGMLHADDPNIWAGIHFILRYFTKVDEFIEMGLSNGKPAFTRSRLPKPSKRRGPPRSRPAAVNPYLNRRGDK